MVHQLLKASVSGRLLLYLRAVRLLGAALFSMPPTSMLAMIWVYRDTRSFWLSVLAAYLLVALALVWLSGIAPISAVTAIG